MHNKYLTVWQQRTPKEAFDYVVDDINKLYQEIQQLKDKLHRRNMQIKNLKTCKQCGSKNTFTVCRECDYENV